MKALHSQPPCTSTMWVHPHDSGSTRQIGPKTSPVRLLTSPVAVTWLPTNVRLMSWHSSTLREIVRSMSFGGTDDSQVWTNDSVRILGGIAA
jgi:hypothetical protein